MISIRQKHRVYLELLFPSFVKNFTPFQVQTYNTDNVAVNRWVEELLIKAGIARTPKKMVNHSFLTKVEKNNIKKLPCLYVNIH